jgi:iron complex outermembrane receptor protein
MTTGLPALLAAFLSHGLLLLPAVPAKAYESIEEIVVTSQRRAQTQAGHAGNIDRVPAGMLNQVLHQHIHELLSRVPGVWISRGSGQEHLTAIRSPVLTGAGSCGAFLFLEDGIPIRPAGFCNTNQLFEINTEQAQSIEVIRGPGNALYGSNALHGIINVLMPTPNDRPATTFGVEIGANDFFRLRAAIPSDVDSQWIATLLYADDGGFREDSGYRQGKAHIKYGTDMFGGDFIGALSLSDLDQETAGFIIGEDAYKDPNLNRQNLNPEAFREAESQRAYGLWNRRVGKLDFDIRPYVRHSDMQFLQHFLPGQPLEENGHTSAGVLSALSIENESSVTIFGLDLEWSDVFLRETQFGETEGSDFLRETRPTGKHYDYDVVGIAIAPYLQANFELTSRLQISAGLRAEYVHYSYDNRMLDGNTRDDGTTCGFGGCLYTRPADRSDSFTNFAPKLAANYSVTESTHLYASLARGFRAPQMTELYRLQNGQQVADLDSEEVDSLEFGIRASTETFGIDASAFMMKKRNSVIRDADGFNVSNARTDHAGVETAINWQLSDRWRIKIDATYSIHQYDFDLIAARGESFVSGRDVDTAPRWIGSAELFFDATDALALNAQWATMGSYYLDAENRFDYGGHELLNLQGHLTFSRNFGISLRLNNVFGEDYADRADYAFGNYRYFPGRGRELFVEFRYAAGRKESL